MDNLTHSLIGAAIGQTGLKKLSGLGMATLVIAANIPDIDAACFFWLEGQEHLAFRRGITHGPLAMVILPALLTGVMVALDRWQGARGKRPAARLPVRPFQLFLLALIGCLSHPAFDWLNNYGIRLLEPFSSRWFYGDTLFIIDVWLWALLIGGVVWSYVRERRGDTSWRVGRWLVALVALYVFANGVITGRAEQAGLIAFSQRGVDPDLRPNVVANAVPLAFWRREVVGYTERPAMLRMDWDLWNGGTTPAPISAWQCFEIHPIPVGNAERDAFVFWTRLPFLDRASDGTAILRDARYYDPRVQGRFSLTMPDVRCELIGSVR